MIPENTRYSSQIETKNKNEYIESPKIQVLPGSYD